MPKTWRGSGRATWTVSTSHDLPPHSDWTLAGPKPRPKPGRHTHDGRKLFLLSSAELPQNSTSRLVIRGGVGGGGQAGQRGGGVKQQEEKEYGEIIPACVDGRSGRRSGRGLIRTPPHLGSFPPPFKLISSGSQEVFRVPEVLVPPSVIAARPERLFLIWRPGTPLISGQQRRRQPPSGCLNTHNPPVFRSLVGEETVPSEATTSEPFPILSSDHR